MCQVMPLEKCTLRIMTIFSMNTFPTRIGMIETKPQSQPEIQHSKISGYAPV